MNNIFVFDNFYSDPYFVRDYALKCDYTLTAPKSWKYNAESILWPGKATESFYKEKDVDIKLSKLLNFPVRTAPDSGFFRLSCDNDKTDYYVHTDGLNDRKEKSFSMVVYLSLPEHCVNKKGTIFYKHKKTGKIKINNAQDYMLTLHDLKVKEAWDIYNVIELKFNRLVVFESNLFHSVGECFGASNVDGRLAQILRANEIV